MITTKKNILKSLLLLFTLLTSFSGIAQCKNVYTIGNYEAAMVNKLNVTKLGPISAKDIPDNLPKSFLEKDGSYAGGAVFCTITDACKALSQLIATGKLASNHWHIYQLDADWDKDTYQPHQNDFRLKHSVKVSKLVLDNCEKELGKVKNKRIINASN